jgi:putative ABC transport system substrate-binding protein
MPDLTTQLHRELIVRLDLAALYRMPAIYSQRFFVASGGLICYGIDTVEQFRQAAAYVDRILRGAKPSELPVQAPTKYEMVINLKTAKALDLTIPQSILLRADEVIE